MPNRPRVTAQKRAFSALLIAVYDRHLADGDVTPREQEEMRHLLRLNTQVDALIDHKDAASVALARRGSTSWTMEKLALVAAWEPALDEIEEVLRTQAADQKRSGQPPTTR